MSEEAGLVDHEDHPPTFGCSNESADEFSSTPCSSLSSAEPLEVDKLDNLPESSSNLKEDSTTSDDDESPADKWLLFNLTNKFVHMEPDHSPLFVYDTDESISIDDDKESVTTTFDFAEYFKLKSNLPTSTSNIEGGPISTDEGESMTINDDDDTKSVISCSTCGLTGNSEFDLHENLPTSSFEKRPISTNNHEFYSSRSLLFNFTGQIPLSISIPLHMTTAENESMFIYDTESSSTSCSSLTTAEDHINNITDFEDSDTRDNNME